MEKLRAHAAAFRAVIHFELELHGGALLVGWQGLPPRFQHIGDEITSLGGTTKGNAQLSRLFIHYAAGNILRRTAQVVIARLHLAAGESSPRELAQVHCGFTIQAPAFDGSGGHCWRVFF